MSHEQNKAIFPQHHPQRKTGLRWQILSPRTQHQLPSLAEKAAKSPASTPGSRNAGESEHSKTCRRCHFLSKHHFHADKRQMLYHGFKYQDEDWGVNEWFVFGYPAAKSLQGSRAEPVPIDDQILLPVRWEVHTQTGPDRQRWGHLKHSKWRKAEVNWAEGLFLPFLVV